MYPPLLRSFWLRWALLSREITKTAKASLYHSAVWWAGGLLPPARHATGSSRQPLPLVPSLPLVLSRQILRNGGGCNRNTILQFSCLQKASAPAWRECLQCATIQYFQLPLALCQSEIGSAKTTRREAGHRRAGRRRQLQGGHPRRGGWDRAAAVAPDQDVPASLVAAPLRHRQRQCCRHRSQPLQHAGGGRRLHWQGRARRRPRRRGRGGHRRRRAPEARHDARRPVQRQRRHREGARGGGGGARAGRAGARDQQPGELHGPDRRGGPEAEGRVRRPQAVRRHGARRGARQRVRRGEEGPPARRRRRAGGRRPLGRHHPAAAVEGAAQAGGGVHGGGGGGADGEGPERGHRGGGGQGRRRVRDAVDGVRGGAVRGGVAAGAGRRRRRVRVRVRGVAGGAGAPVLRVQGEAREGRGGGGGGVGAQGALRVRGARAGGAQAAAQGQHRQGRRLRAAAAGGGLELNVINLMRNWPPFLCQVVGAWLCRFCSTARQYTPFLLKGTEKSILLNPS